MLGHFRELEERIKVGLDSHWVLEGLLNIGQAINVWNMEVIREQDDEPLSYYRFHIEIDDDPQLYVYLDAKLHGPVEYFDRVILMQEDRRGSSQKHVYTFRKPWLYSLERNSRYSGRSKKKPVLGIAFEKSAVNKSAVEHIKRLGI